MAFGMTSPEQRAQRRADERARTFAALASATLRPTTSVTMEGGTRAAVPKVVPIECEAYRRLVAALPCKNCGIHGYSQAAHPNTNKGAGTKTDDRLCFPLCTVHPEDDGLVPGCHSRFDQGALYSKAVRRELEPVWGADTRRTIEAAGAWPKNLPKWSEE
jgi:hypothetical protein